MKKTLGVVIDESAKIDPQKDSTLAMMVEAARRGFEIFTMQIDDLFIAENAARGFCHRLKIDNETPDLNFEKNILVEKSLTDFNWILMRKNPPFDIRYIYATYLLEHAEKAGVAVINKPRALRDFNEKWMILNFPDDIPETLVASRIDKILTFLQHKKTIIIKPLDKMGGADIFKLDDRHLDDARTKISRLTKNGTMPIVAQIFLPEIENGDRRILLIDGAPLDHALVRVPKPGSFKGNLVQGASAHAEILSENDRRLCEKIAPMLRENGLRFVGLDIIGGKITEINITSPTGIRELNRLCNLNIAAKFWDAMTN